MNEVTKLYKNAGIKSEWRYIVHQFCHFYETDKEDILRNKHLFKERKTARIKKAEKKYPPFTAKKQIAIIKLISKQGQVIIENWEKDNRGFNVTFRANSNLRYITMDCITRKTVEEALAQIVNDLWQDLTEEEKQQIKEILSE